MNQQYTELCRKLTFSEKWVLMGELYRTARTVHAETVRFYKPAATEEEVRDDWLAMTAGPEVLAAVKAHRKQAEEESNPSLVFVVGHV